MESKFDLIKDILIDVDVLQIKELSSDEWNGLNKEWKKLDKKTKTKSILVIGGVLLASVFMNSFFKDKKF